jgi:hypothetical protein
MLGKNGKIVILLLDPALSENLSPIPKLVALLLKADGRV